jgi:hypothetical protein
MLGERRESGRARLGAGVDRQEIVVAAHEFGDPVLVLGPENRARNIDDPPASLNESQRVFKRFVLVLDPLLERAGADAPFAVGIAPPGSEPVQGASIMTRSQRPSRSASTSSRPRAWRR